MDTITTAVADVCETVPHGSPYDRGRADSYYRRPRSPHFYPEGTYNGPEVTDLTEAQRADYNRGYDWNQVYGDFKDYGDGSW